MDELNEKGFDELLENKEESVVRVGKPKSDEWKKKHSESMKLAHARKKEGIKQL